MPDTITVDNTGVPINGLNIGQFKRYIYSMNKAKFSIDDPDDMDLLYRNLEFSSDIESTSLSLS